MTIAALALATAGGILLLALPSTKRTRRRNQDAFDAELPRLGLMGFEPADGLSPPKSAVMRPIRFVRRTLVRDGSPRVWLVECEPVALAINSLWPTRCAVIEAGRRVPTGTLVPQVDREGAARDYVSTFAESPEVGAFVRMLRGVVDGHLKATIEADGEVIRIWSVQTAKPVGKEASAPIALGSLADIAVAAADDLRGEKPGPVGSR